MIELNRETIAKALYELDPYVAPQEYLGCEASGALQLVGGGVYTWEQAKEADAAFAAVSFYQPLTADAYRMADAALNGPETIQRQAACIEMLSKDRARMRAAGLALAEAALHVVREYDGVHRLSLAVAAWAKAIADEGGREERHKPVNCVFPVVSYLGDPHPVMQMVLPLGR